MHSLQAILKITTDLICTNKITIFFYSFEGQDTGICSLAMKINVSYLINVADNINKFNQGVILESQVCFFPNNKNPENYTEEINHDVTITLPMTELNKNMTCTLTFTHTFIQTFTPSPSLPVNNRGVAVAKLILY